jgi:hypothetical protein
VTDIGSLFSKQNALLIALPLCARIENAIIVRVTKQISEDPAEVFHKRSAVFRALSHVLHLFAPNDDTVQGGLLD